MCEIIEVDRTCARLAKWRSSRGRRSPDIHAWRTARRMALARSNASTADQRASNGARMTPTRFREILTLFGWSQRQLATVLNISERRSRKWAAGGAEIPPAVAEWLEFIVAPIEAQPFPQGWRATDPEEVSEEIA
jgi:DNA-binding transcriptional regulator YiaG